MQTTDQVAGEAREKLADEMEAESKHLEAKGAEHPNVRLSFADVDLIVAALRAQPERGAEEIGIEQIARAMCRHQIHHNQFTWNPREPLSAESVQRAEDAGWQQWDGFAQAVAAAIRALPLHPAKDEGGGR